LLLKKELPKFYQAYTSLIISEMTKRSQRNDYENEGGKDDMELPIFDMAEIANATDNFSRNNKLREGGFGPVYKVNDKITN
jgi:hypothetical protein